MAASVSTSIKMLVTVFLTLQVACMVLVLRYSMVNNKYILSTAVILGEAVKMVVSFLGLVIGGFNTGNPLAAIRTDLASGMELTGLLKMSIPAMLYLLQNNLLFFGMANLDAGTYQVTYQLKTLTTAAVSVAMLGTRLGQKQWIALLVLSIGVGICQWKPTEGGQTTGLENRPAGVCALIAACCTSSIAGVYTEKVLKQSQVSLWVRNIQLAFWSILAGVAALYSGNDGATIVAHGWLQGYTPIVWVVVLLQGATGILVALVMKYADNIIKNFSVAMATVIATCASIPLFDLYPNSYFVFGMSLVFVSMYMYSTGAAKKPEPAEAKVEMAPLVFTKDDSTLDKDLEACHEDTEKDVEC
eukprot:TRINITY_DN6190_c0_g1_i2.p1 TRINITY_DN6190_c0_g1~~TRINITY_DN6190_c0_g1_i2.p1  ORF type:complete len:358 (+),score=99.41 TRINITY_DN6190_c0_g1_i2:189-1262(+)